jgi:hypothetical protein
MREPPVLALTCVSPLVAVRGGEISFSLSARLRCYR